MIKILQKLEFQKNGIFLGLFSLIFVLIFSLVTPSPYLISDVQTFLKLDGNKKTLFYAEVSEKDKVSNGGGVAAEGEMIEVVELSVDEVKDYLKMPNANSPASTLHGLQWFLLNKADNMSVK